MQCHILHLNGPKSGTAQNFEAARITIGRASNCDLQFDPSTELTVASHHAEILLDDDAFYIHDLGSRGGTYVNGEKISDRRRLHTEDYLRFGRTGPEVIFRLGLAAPGPQPLPPKAPETGEVELLSGFDAGKVFPILGDRPNRIGRRSDLDVPLDPRGDMVVSGNHCTITYEDDSFVLTDTSRNGTFINGSPVNGSAFLSDGDIITLGEDGPRARFSIHPPQRVYPNQGKGVARAPGQRERSHEELFSPTGAEAANATALAADAASASAVSEPPPQEQTQNTSPDVESGHQAEVGAAGGAPPLQTDIHEERSEDESQMPRSQSSVETVEPASQERARGAILVGLPFSKSLIAAVLLGFVAIVGLAWLLIRGVTGESPQEPAGIAAYESQIRKAEGKRNEEGHYSFQLPESWNSRQEGGLLSMESQEKLVKVDYVRDERLSEGVILDLLTRDGGTAKKLPGAKEGEVTRVSYVSTSGNKSRMAVLHQPEGDTPALAMLEAPDNVFQELSSDAIESLLIDNPKLQRLAAEPAASPGEEQAVTAPQPPADQPGPAPEVASPAVAPEIAQDETPASQEEIQTVPAPPEVVVESAALRVRFEMPSGWSGTSNEEERVVSLTSPRGVHIHIARDPEPLASNITFQALQSEGWELLQKGDGLEISGTGRQYSAAVMKQGDSHLLLVLLDQPDKSTFVVYATSSGPMNEEQRADVANIVGQIARQTSQAAE